MGIKLTPSVKALAIACFTMFLVQKTLDQFFNVGLISWLALIPQAFLYDFRFWQLITYSFLHADPMHLFLNLMMLVFIGGEIEAVWGKRRFLSFYFTCVVSGGLFYLLLQVFFWKGTGLITPMVGASAGIYGLLMAYGLMFSERQLLFMMLFPMKAKHFVWILALIEFMTTVFSGREGLSGVAHLGGMAAGFTYLWLIALISRTKKRRTIKKRVSKVHLKLVIDNDKSKAPKVQVETDHDESDPKTWH